MLEAAMIGCSSTEENHREAKRQKHGPGDSDGEEDLLRKVKKLYNEVVLQAAIIFQFMDYSKRIGLVDKKVPTHMTERLELSWRAYEGIRSRIQWDTAEGDLSKMLSPMPPLPLPKSTTLANSIPSSVSPIPLKSLRSSSTVPFPKAPVSRPAPLTIVSRLAEPRTTQMGISSPIPLGATSSLAFEGQSLQEAPSFTAIQSEMGKMPTLDRAAQTQAQIPTSAQANQPSVDYSSLGFDELSQFIHGDPSAFRINLNPTPQSETSSQTQTQRQQASSNQEPVQMQPQGQKQPEIIDLTADDKMSGMYPPADRSQEHKPQPMAISQPQTASQLQSQNPSGPSLADEVLASLGFSDLSDIDLAANANGTGFDMGGQHDYSALAGLFLDSSVGPSGQQAQEPQQPSHSQSQPQSRSESQSQLPAYESLQNNEQPAATGVVIDGAAAKSGKKKEESMENMLAAADNLIATTSSEGREGQGQPAQSLQLPRSTDPEPQQQQRQKKEDSAQEQAQNMPNMDNMGNMNFGMGNFPSNNGLGDSLGDLEGIDMSDFNFRDEGSIGGEEFERLMAEFA
ncbi:uncharacterized protein L203_104877 [Cryptococcus depauperatus CBS 7841]|uniref:Uncharacterized protein n=1 Tax=Cryptococcus depauperatus CBS 7841 TaxID=1295531 RepID=A0AAJ8JWA1_9TREE